MADAFPAGYLDCERLRSTPQDSGQVRLYMSVLFYACIDGSGHVHAPQARFPFAPGQCFFMGSGQSHRLDCREPATFAVLQITQYSFPHRLFGDHDIAELLAWLGGRALEGEHGLPLDAAATALVHRGITGLADEATRTYRGRNAVLKAQAILTLSGILRSQALPPDLDLEVPYASSLGRIAAVLGHIQDHHAERITVAEMAGLAGLSRSHFHAAFRKATGCSLIEYVNRYRLMRAKGDLLRTDTPMARIAQRHGFGNASRFATVHRQVYGTTPKEARRRYRDEHQRSNLQRFGGIGAEDDAVS